MHLIEFSKVQDFLVLTQDTLELNESANHLMLGICLQLRDEPERYAEPPFLAAVLDEQEQVILCAVMTPPYPLVLQAMEGHETEINQLVSYILRRRISITGVNGRVGVSSVFANLWQSATGLGIRASMALRVYELKQVIMPDLPIGRFRQATQKDAETVLAWFMAFQEEAIPEGERLDNSEHIKNAIDMGNVYVWERAGNLVSMALRQRPTSHAVSVSGVYTPLEERKKGYASACVAKLTQLLLDEGFTFVNLFTDLANPTSNDIYQKIGYKPICDFDRYSFD
ncbi:MAG: GNAT family N-acetyltransferase [Chloroflexota bacterium]